MKLRLGKNILLVLFLVIANFIFGAIPAQERAALIALYNSTNGDNWIIKSGWKTPPLDSDGFAMPGTEGSWAGITLSGDNVVGISLAGRLLNGTIPTELGNLSLLQSLNLAANQLSGSIPVELSNLSQLTHLHLYRNQLTGSIPTQLGSLNNLQELLLNENQLEGIIPTALSNLSQLTHLYLHNNQLTGSIPVELSTLGQLQRLALSGNQLTGSIPVELSNLSQLSHLYLNNNQLTGSIPVELGNLNRLTLLYLNNNQLSGGIPIALSNLSLLTILELNNNRLSGSLPVELGNLSNLLWLYLDNNLLNGSIPLELGNLSKLQRLTLSGNQLSGTIPTELCNLSNLTWLYLNNNQLNGTIPIKLGNLSKLQQLSLAGNQLDGNIPVEFAYLTNLEILNLGNNQLSGNIPPGFGNLSKLKELYLQDNQLSGGVPLNFTDMTAVTALDIGYNCLSAADPSLRAWLDSHDADWESTQNHCGPIKVTSPDGGEALVSGSLHDITWTDAGAVEYVKIEYTTNNGADWNIIIASTSNSGSYSWLVPAAVSSQCRVRISEASGGTPSDSSDNPFSIGNPTLTVTSPNGGEKWDIGSVHNILWTSAGAGGYVSIHYSGDNGATWAKITSYTENDGSYSWTAPSINSTNCLVRVRDCGGAPTDTSDAVFEISRYIPTQERAALIALYNATNGDNWTNKSGWKTAPLDTDGFALRGTEESWYGIDLKDQHVARVSLWENQLEGTIPPALGNLTQLTELYLTGNRLSGSIPPELGNLSLLTLLHLKYNRLTGAIPDQLGNLGNLLYLSMCYNQLSGFIPPQLGNLGKLQILNLGGNQLSGSIPAQLGNLAQLRELKLNNNQLSGGIPPELGYLPLLQYLYLSNNQLSEGIPPGIGNLSNLQYLLLDSNRLHGEIPVNLTQLTHIIGLDIGTNCLQATEQSLRNWLNNYDPDWESTQNHCGELTLTSPAGGETWEPGTLHDITWTSNTSLGNVKIQYSANNGADWTTIIPSCPDSGSYSWLTPDIASSQCRVKISEATGGYPWDISKGAFTIGAVTSIIVTSPNGGESWLEGSPRTITWTAPGTVENVRIEYSDDNGSGWTEIVSAAENNGVYSWTVPAVSSPQYLVRISDSGGTLTDTSDSTFVVYNGIPAQERAALIAIYNSTGGDSWIDNSGWKTPPLHSDGFALPGTEGSWYGLYVEANHVVGLDLGNNQLSGSIPPAIENLCALEYLTLTRNQLSGPIPPELGSLDQLRVLDLTDNRLSGPIPPGLGNLANLEILFLDRNQLSGEIPVGLANLTNIDLWDLNIKYNCLYTADPTLRTWLYNHCPDWESEQKNCGTISLITPNGGEAWLVGSIHTVACTATEEVGAVKIEYSINNGSGWTTISASTNYPYRYNWTIPDTVSTQCRVRISKATGGSPFDVSENTFIIYKGVPSQERAQLIALYNSTNGDNWLDNSGWKTAPLHVDGFALPGSESSWHGITALNGPVTHIQLGGNRLTGTIPTEIGNLSSLQELRLNANVLSGSIPTSLQNLTLLAPGATDIGYNALFTTDAALKTFLDSKDEDWSTTQTVPPANAAAQTVSFDCIDVSWDPIGYTRDAGGYRVYAAEQSGGPYTLAGATTSKNKTAISVSGLESSQIYYFVIQTYTNPHANNSNTVESPYSDEVSANTMAYAHITVTYPAGGEAIAVGTGCDIAWTSVGVSQVKIELLKGNRSYLTIAPAVSAGENTYRWNIPARVPAGSDYQVKVSSTDTGVFVSGTSQMFSVIPDISLVLNSPLGTEVWRIRQSYDISWGSRGIANIKIELYKGESLYMVISESTSAGAGRYTWTVPADLPLGTDYKIKISAVDAGIDFSDISKDVFAIAGYKPAAADFDGDGRADLLWRYYGTGGNNCIWATSLGTAQPGLVLDDPRNAPQAVVIPDETNTANTIAGTGDFNEDGHEDILWRNTNDGTNFLWLMNGTIYASTVSLESETNLAWDIVGTGDFNNDGKVDILWRHTANGSNRVWLMNGAARQSEISLSAETDLAWGIVGAGDFNSDGNVDILWRHTVSGSNRVWLMNGTALVQVELLPSYGTDWQIVGTGDYDGNGKPDIFWRNSTDGRDMVWLLDGLNRNSALILTRVTNLDWQIEN